MLAPDETPPLLVALPLALLLPLPVALGRQRPTGEVSPAAPPSPFADERGETYWVGSSTDSLFPLCWATVPLSLSFLETRSRLCALWNGEAPADGLASLDRRGQLDRDRVALPRVVRSRWERSRGGRPSRDVRGEAESARGVIISSTLAVSSLRSGLGSSRPPSARRTRAKIDCPSAGDAAPAGGASLPTLKRRARSMRSCSNRLPDAGLTAGGSVIRSSGSSRIAAWLGGRSSTEEAPSADNTSSSPSGGASDVLCDERESQMEPSQMVLQQRVRPSGIRPAEPLSDGSWLRSSRLPPSLTSEHSAAGAGALGGRWTAR